MEKTILTYLASLILTFVINTGRAQWVTDKPHSIQTPEQLKEYDELIAPYVSEAQQSLPSVKEKFAKGLEKDQTLFLTIRIYDNEGRFEQIFTRVTKWESETIFGTIANEINVVKGFVNGQTLEFPESSVLDWLIAYPDRSEEGNYVGKFLDSMGKGDEAVAGMKKWELEGQFMSVMIPLDWYLRRSPDGRMYQAEYNCGSINFCTNIVFVFLESSPVDEVARTIVTQLPRQFPKHELLQVIDTTVNKIQYRVVDYKVVREGLKYGYTTLITNYHKRTAMINFTSADKKKKPYKFERDLFFSIVNTIQVKD